MLVRLEFAKIAYVAHVDVYRRVKSPTSDIISSATLASAPSVRDVILQ